MEPETVKGTESVSDVGNSLRIDGIVETHGGTTKSRMKEGVKSGSLYEHQRQGLELARQNPRWGYWWSLGLGKSLLGLSIIEEYGKLHRCILVTRKNLIRSAWMEDYEKFGFDFKFTNVCGMDKKDRLEAYKDWDSHIAVSFETFRVDYDQIKKSGFHVMIVDESAALKSATAQITKRMLDFSKTLSRAYLLSGCPWPNNEAEAWAQYQIIAPGTFPSSFFAFRSSYFTPSKFVYMGGVKRPVQFALNNYKKKHFNEKLKTNAWFLRKEDVLQLPEQIFTRRVVELTPKCRNMYDQFVTEWLTKVGDNVLVARNRLAELIKVRQFCAGIALDGEQRLVVDDMPPKTQELLDILEDTDESVIVACEFKFEIERVKEALEKHGITCRTYYGETPDGERHQIVKDFQAGLYRVLVGHPRSFGPGLTLTRSSTIVFHSLSYSYESFFQTCGRVHRIGQSRACNYIALIAKDTIDEIMWDALNHKQDVATALLEKLVRIKVKEAV